MVSQTTAVRSQLLTLSEVAKMLALSPRTVRNRTLPDNPAFDKKFPNPILLGSTVRFELKEIEEYLKRCKEVIE